MKARLAIWLAEGPQGLLDCQAHRLWRLAVPGAHPTSPGAGSAGYRGASPVVYACARRLAVERRTDLPAGLPARR